MAGFLKKGDLVRIIDFGTEKHGKIGLIANLVTNGAFIKLPDGIFTPILYAHLEKCEKKLH